MKLKRQLSPQQIQRVKFQCLFVLSGLCFSLLTSNLVDAQVFDDEGALTLRPPYEGSYAWQGQEMSGYMRTDRTNGYIEQYANGNLCPSPVILPGFALLGEGFVCLFLIVALFYLFIGVSVLSDKFSDAIYVITSKTEDVDIYEQSGKLSVIRIPIWNAQIAYVTIMALGCSAPEIFLCFYGQFRDSSLETGVETLPTTMGPMILVGSASINLFIGGGLAILGAAEAKKVESLGAYAVTAIFGTVAYLWLYIVVCVNTPAYIDIGEAVVTLLLYLLLVLSVYATERCTHSHDEQEEQDLNRRRICRAQLHRIAESKGKLHVLEAATGYCTDVEAQEIKEFFKYLLCDCNASALQPCTCDLSTRSVDELVDALEPENPIQRLGYRRKINIRSYRGFTKANQSTLHKDLDLSKTRNPDVGFSATHYSVFENREHVLVKIEKRCAHDITFLLVTQNGTAEAGSDYKPKREMMTMKADETEREVAIAIVDDPDVEPDEDFHVLLLDEQTSQPLPGCDTKAVVTIVDNDDPGYLGFTEECYRCSPRDQAVTITVKRFKGAAGPVACYLRVENALEDPHDEYGAPRREVEVEPIEVYFADHQIEQEVVIPVAMSAENTHEHFRVVLCEPDPEDIKLSMRNYCVIEVRRSEEDLLHEVRANMMGAFVQNNDPTWCGQFKQACILGPVIDEYDNVDEVTCWEALVHLCTMPWRIAFAIVPPKRLAGGWPAFVACFLLIGIISFFIMELATTVGCLLGVKTVVQALVFVCVGTSLPDILTTYEAAGFAKNAGPALNILTASNAANVFVGLGLPWTIAAIYQWRLNGENLFIGRFEVADIAFATVLFIIFSLTSFVILGLRRCCVHGEIGGPNFCKAISACSMFLLWALFVGLNILNCYEYLPDREAFVPAYAVMATQVGSLDCPATFDPITTVESDEYVTLVWTYPKTPGAAFSSCQIQVQLEDGEFTDVTEYCDCSTSIVFTDSKCSIPHTYLHNDLGISSCAQLKARGRLNGDTCQGNWSIPDEEQVALVHGCPVTYDLVNTSASDATSITLEWTPFSATKMESGCAPIDRYELEVKEKNAVSGAQWTPWYDLIDRQMDYQQTRYAMDDRGDCTTSYRFRGRATNKYCSGNYSPVLEDVKAGCQAVPSFPSEQAPVLTAVTTTYAANCNVMFSWQKPFCTRDDITNYNIFVRGQNGGWQQIPNCGNGGNSLSCTVPMATLGGAPFFLQSGDYITVKGLAVSASLGPGVYSFTNASQVQVTGQPAAPSLSVYGDSLSWYSSGQSSNVLSYDIWQSTDNGQYIKIDSTTSPSYTIQNSGDCNHCGPSVPAGNHQYKIQARSQCGESVFSNVAMMSFTSAPGVPQNVGLSVVACQLNIVWNEPEDGGSAITEYVVEIRDLSGNFQRYGGCTNPMFTNCSVDMQELRLDPYYLVPNSWIVVRLTAGNAIGYGSATNDIDNYGLQVLNVPSKMFAPTVIEESSGSVARVTWNTLASGSSGYITSYELYNYSTLIYTGPATSFRQNIEQGQQYSFSVQARNSCGPGIASPTASYIQVIPAPSMEAPLVTVSDCLAHFNWEIPSNDVTQYVLELKSSTNQFVSLQAHCQSNYINSCSVPMSILMRSPYNLSDGSSIVAKVKAKNQSEWGNFSVQSRTSALVQSGPPTPQTPYSTAQTANGVTLAWGNIDSNISTEIYWNSLGGSMSLLALVQSGQNTYGVTNNSNDFSFKIRHHNECGWGAFSNVVQVSFPKPPGIVNVCITSLVQCDVMMSWTPPSVNGSNISYYKVMVLGSDQQWHPVDQCGNNGRITCIVSMNYFTASPFRLSVGTLIQVKVAAQNSEGPGPYSVPNRSGVNVNAVPFKVSLPVLQNSSLSSATFTWDTMFGVTYEVHGVQVGSNSFYKLYDTDYNTYTVQNLIPGTTYRYKVLAKNDCGSGPLSEEIQIRMQGVPAQMMPVVAQDIGCAVRFNWTASNARAQNIDSYVFKVITAASQPIEIRSCSTSYNAECQVQMSTLAAAPYNIVPGTPIYATIQACNVVGCSPVSAYNVSIIMTGNPSAVSNLSYYNSPSSGNSIILTWTGSSGGATQYEVYNKGDSNTYNLQATVQSTQTSVTISNLSPGVTNCFVMRATNSCGGSNYSNEITVSLANVPGSIGLYASIQDCYVSLSWNSPNSDGGSPITGYDIQMYSNNQWRTLSTNTCNPGTSLSCAFSYGSIDSLNFGSSNNIRFKGRAINIIGVGGFSTESSIQVPSSPVSPLLEFVSLTKTSVSMEWNDVSNGAIYEVYWDQGLDNNNYVLERTVYQNNHTIAPQGGLTQQKYKFYIKVAGAACGQGQVQSNILYVCFDQTGACNNI